MIVAGHADVIAARDLLPALVVVQVMARAFIHGDAVLVGVTHGVVDSVDVVMAAVVAPVAAGRPAMCKRGKPEGTEDQRRCDDER